MKYKKFLIVASKLDKAGMNIVTQLRQFGNFDIEVFEKDIIHTENIDIKKINSYDFIIFASKHSSKSKEKSLCVHAPGNWRFADHGGEKGRVCKTSALLLKQMFISLNENKKKFNLKDYKVTMEATHHGPLIEKPCLFIEVGSTEEEWTHKKASFVIAKTISETIENFKENPYSEVAIAIGGPHYCPNFNKIQLNSNVAISHVVSSYAFPLTEEMIKEAFDKTEEQVDFFLLDWKGLGNAHMKKEALENLDKFYIPIKKTSEIEK
ncbi:MAG: D-aminoacyl-tRNA deacylase [Candidatus Pacearchaeota archaeon]